MKCSSRNFAVPQGKFWSGLFGFLLCVSVILSVSSLCFADLLTTEEIQQITDLGSNAADQDQQLELAEKELRRRDLTEDQRSQRQRQKQDLENSIQRKRNSARSLGGREGERIFDDARSLRTKWREKLQAERELRNATGDRKVRLQRTITRLGLEMNDLDERVGRLGMPSLYITLPLSGVVNPVGGDSGPIQVFGGYQLNDEVIESFLEPQGTGSQKTDSSTGNSQNQGTDNQKGQTPQAEPKSWTPQDGIPLDMFFGNSKNTFGFQYSVGYQYLNQEAEVWVVAGSDQYLGKWSTYISQQYDGMAIEDIEVVVDTTPTFITGLPRGADPWAFKWEWAQEGFDMTQWRGETLPFGGVLQWKISEDVFTQFTTQAGSKLSYFEQDPTTRIAPAPGLYPNSWPVQDDAHPVAHLILRRVLP